MADVAVVPRGAPDKKRPRCRIDTGMASVFGWRADLRYDSPEAVAVRADLRGSGLPDLDQLTVDPSTEGFEKLACERFRADGFVVIKNALDASRLARLRAATDTAVREICALDPMRNGNSSHHHRYSFGRASLSGYERDPDWCVMVDTPAVLAVLAELWGPQFVCNGLGGDFSLPGAIGKQGLHSDINAGTEGGRFKYEVLQTPEAIARRPRHFGINNSNLQEGRGRMFTKPVPINEPERPGVEYLIKDDSCLDRTGLCGFVNVDFCTTDWTDDIGATQIIPGSHLAPLPCPKLDEENRQMRHSTLAGVRAGSAVVRDLRLFHAGTPNVSNRVRCKPASSYVAPWYTRQPDARPMTQRAYRSLSPAGQKVCAAIVGDEEDCPAEYYRDIFGENCQQHKPYYKLVDGWLVPPTPKL